MTARTNKRVAAKVLPRGRRQVTSQSNGVRRSKRHLDEEARLLDLSSDAIISHDLYGRIVFWSRGAERLYGWPRGTAMGKEIHELLHTQFPQPRERIAAALARKGAWSGELVRTTRAGDRRTVLSREILQKQGRRSLVFESDTDITERRNSLEQLQESEERFRTLADDAPVFVWIADPDINVTYANRTYLDFVGFNSLAEMGGKGWENFMHPEDLPRIHEVSLKAVRERKPAAMELRMRSGADAEYRWYLFKGTPRYVANTFTGLMGIGIDIDELKRTEAALRESEERFHALSDNIAQLAWISDADGHIIWFNKRWSEYTGTALEDIKSMGWKIVHHPDYSKRVLANWSVHLNEGTEWEDTFPLRGKDGQFRWFLSRALPIHDTRGKVVRWFGTNTDVTELRETQEALERARGQLLQHTANLERTVADRTAELKDMNDQLEAFVYSIAHDLRAPLRALQGFSQLLLETESPIAERERDFLGNIHRSAEYMDKMILDLLAFGRTARAQIELRPVNVGRAWDGALFQCASQIQQTGAKIQVTTPLPTVCAHESSLAQALANLLSNSLKFVEPGVVPKIRFWSEDAGDFARLWLEDNGVGIPQEDHQRIFHVFERLHGARFPGTGIGLSIVRKSVERMNGRVGLQSEPGKGTRFWIELPKA